METLLAITLALKKKLPFPISPTILFKGKMKYTPPLLAFKHYRHIIVHLFKNTSTSMLRPHNYASAMRITAEKHIEMAVHNL
jgi:hypothetical protein